MVTVFSLAVLLSLSSTAINGRPSSPSELRNKLAHHDHHSSDSTTVLRHRDSRSAPDQYEDIDVSVHIFTNSSERCDQGISDESGVNIQLQYRTLNMTGDGSIDYSPSEWKSLECFMVHFADNPNGYEMAQLTSNVSVAGIRWIQFRLRQLEHGGGGCNCWSTCDFRVEDISVDFSVPDSHCYIQQGGGDDLLSSHRAEMRFQFCPLNEDNEKLQLFTFCGGSSSVVRGIVSRVIDLDPPSDDINTDSPVQSLVNCTNDEQLVDIEEDEFNFTACSGILPHIEMRFQLGIGVSSCDRPDHRDEGVEVSFGNWNGNGEWIPIQFYAPSNGDTPMGQRIVIGDTINDTYIVIRGRRVPFVVRNNSESMTQSLFICGDQFLGRDGQMQFRWLQTVWQVDAERDIWSLDSVNITLRYNATAEEVLIDEDFETFNASVWNIRAGRWLNNVTRGRDQRCEITRTVSNNPLIVFGFEIPIFSNDINSRFISSTPIDVRTLLEGGIIALTDTHPTITPPTVTPPTITTSPNDETVASPSTTTTTSIDPRDELLRQEEERILNIIFEDPELYAIFISPAVEAAEMLEEVIERRSDEEVEIDEAVTVYLLGTIFNNASNTNITDPEFNEAIVEISSGILKRTDPEDDATTITTITGSTLLRQLDNFALNVFDNVSLIRSDMIEHHVVMRSDNDDEDEDDMVSVIEVKGAEIMLPRQLLRMFGGQGGQLRMRVGSFFYSNMSGLLPETLGDFDDTRLASPVISTALQCDDERGGKCPTEQLDLDQPVTITITHSPAIMKLIETSNITEVTCVFWKFFESRGGGILNTGDWSTVGCSRNDNLSTNALTVCECNHLTHFAILLSATGTQFSPGVTLSLQIIGYIGVSVSLVAMVITVGIFIFFKSLWSMRSYIHINLCVNLFIVQLVFVAGIEPRLAADDSQQDMNMAPVSCQVVAVLLHYFFLVTFMWMLMEGVVLYVVLVRVFVKYHKRYLIAFTVISYGLPLLYMCALTLPLGFALSGVSGYGYSTACFLNPHTKFIWAFIAPVILIILVNIVFFIMAMTIMFRHQRRQTNKSTVKNVKHWLKASVSLLVIMGITWLMGVLVLNVDALLPVAYIFTILVAFQGVFIFILFVIFSEQFQDARSKWWRSKVAESEFLSRHFGEKSLANSTRMTGMRSAPSSSMEKSSHEATFRTDKDGLSFELEQSTKIPLENEKPPPVEKEKAVKKGTLQRQGTTFEVTLVPFGSLENLTDDTHFDSDKPVPDSFSNGNLVNRPTTTAVPNDYQSPNEIMKPNTTTNSHPV